MPLYEMRIVKTDGTYLKIALDDEQEAREALDAISAPMLEDGFVRIGKRAVIRASVIGSAEIRETKGK
jgi:hypothetical protein